MARKDVREKAALNDLQNARKKQAEAARILTGTPRDADRARDDALRAATLLSDAKQLAASAATSAEEFKTSAQTNAARELHKEAVAFKSEVEAKESIISPIVDSLQRPNDKSSQKKLTETLKKKSRDVAADQIASELMSRLVQYATAHTMDGLITALFNLPINDRTINWAGRGLGEVADNLRTRYRTASTGVNQQTGACDSRRQCHQCQANARDGGIRTCRNFL